MTTEDRTEPTSAKAGTEQARLDPRDVFIRGKHVLLKALSEADATESSWYGWFNSPETTASMQQHYFPNSQLEQLNFWKESIVGSRTKLQLGICRAEGTELLGCTSLNDINYINRTADISTIIGDSGSRNVKLFLEANELILEHAFNTLNLHRVGGGTMIKEVMELMCRTHGFRHEGTAKEAIYKNGTYRDVYLIGLIRGEFRKAF